MHRRGTLARDEQGTWDIGGGGLRFGERPEDCLAREIREEYCTDIVAHDFLGYRDVHRTLHGQPTHWVALDFIVQVDRAQVAVGEPDKMDEIAWFTLDSMPPYAERHSDAPTFWKLHEAKIVERLVRVPVLV